MDCLFCKIIAGEIPSTKVYEDDIAYAFEDINPQAGVHVLVIPKQHVESVEEAGMLHPGTLDGLFRSIREVAREKGIAESGYRVVSNIGEHGAQTVKHLHFHVIGGEQLSGRMG